MSYNISEGYDLSIQQKRLIQANRVLNCNNRNVLSFEIKGNFSKENIRNAVENVVARHEMLQTRLIDFSSLKYPLQFISDEGNQGVRFSEKSSEVNKDIDFEFIRKSDNRGILRCTSNALFTDNQSLNILFLDLCGALENELNGSHQEDEEGLQYIDFSEWQNELLENMNGEARFWQNQLKKEHLITSLPFEGCRQVSGQVESTDIHFSKEEYNGLRELSVRIATPVSKILLACFQLLIKQYNKNAVVSYNHNGREQVELQQTIGLFEKYLPLTTEQDFEVQTLIEQIKQVDAVIAKHAELEKFFDLDQVIGGGAFNYLPFCFESKNIPAYNSELLTFEIIEHKVHTDIYKLKMTCTERSSDHSLALQYDGQIFSSEIIDIVILRFRKIIEYVISDGEKRASASKLASAKEEKIILEKFNNDIGQKSGSTFIDKFSAVVRKCPDSKAIQFGMHELTYQELDESSNKVANYLRNNHGIVAGDTVALQLRRGEKLIPILIGILKSGAAYIPIDLSFPHNRVKFILENSNAKLFIMDSDFENEHVTCAVERLGEIWEKMSFMDRSFATEVKDSDIAYIIYTSGTTGKPKGVLVAHGALNNYLDWFTANYKVSIKDKTLLFSSIAFDLSYSSLWTALYSGATLVLLEENEYLEPGLLLNALSKHAITYLKLTPSHLKFIVDYPEIESVINNLSLRLVVCGGEKIIFPDVKRFFDLKSDVLFVNHYGPTETTIGVVVNNISRKELERFEITAAIGKPIDNNKAFIVDEKGQLCGVGITGELCVSGLNLAEGYLNQKELTRQKFVDNPFDEGKMYKTGDIARWLPDGRLEFIGRADAQVKIRGYRIEVSEVEEILKSQSKVKNALVVVIENSLFAYVEGGEHMEIQNHLKENLPEYMIPSGLLILDSFPLTKHGKIDRSALPDPSISGNINYVAPTTDLEKGLVRLWEEVLGRQPIGIQDNFFEVGGHSLNATKLISQVQKQLHIKLTLKELFTYTTIKSLAERLVSSDSTYSDEIIQVKQQESYAVSPAQKHMWITNRLDSSNISFNMPKAYFFKGNLDLDVLEKATYEVISRHETLRTYFVEIDNEPRQKIINASELKFSIDVQDFRFNGDQEEAKTWINSQSRMPFDLEHAPLFRVCVAKMEDDLQVILLVMHHLISDAWSKEILTKEILALYNAFSNHQANPLSELKVQYKDYLGWVENKLQGTELDRLRSFWLKQFEGELPVLDMPLDKPRPAIKTFNGNAVRFNIDQELSEQLQLVIKQHEVSLFMLLMASFNALLSRYTGQEDIIVGTPVSGRSHSALENQIGLYLSSMALRTRFRKDDSLQALMMGIKQNIIESFDHQMYPFELLIEDLSIKRDPSRAQLFDVVLVLGNKEFNESYIETKEVESATINSMDTGFRSSTVDLRLVFSEGANGINFFIEYNTDLFFEETIQTFGLHMIKVMECFASDLNVKICDLPITAELESKPEQGEIEDVFSFRF